MVSFAIVMKRQIFTVLGNRILICAWPRAIPTEQSARKRDPLFREGFYKAATPGGPGRARTFTGNPDDLNRTNHFPASVTNSADR
jgi:hypothetical protein